MHLRASKLTPLVHNDHQPSVAPETSDAVLRVHNNRGRHYIYTYELAVPSELSTSRTFTSRTLREPCRTIPLLLVILLKSQL